MALYAPQPTQDIYGENGDARSSGNASKRLFCAGLAMRESVAADHDCNQTGNLRDGAGEKSLDSVKAGVEGTPLSVSRHRLEQEKGKPQGF